VRTTKQSTKYITTAVMSNGQEIWSNELRLLVHTADGLTQSWVETLALVFYIPGLSPSKTLNRLSALAVHHQLVNDICLASVRLNVWFPAPVSTVGGIGEIAGNSIRDILEVSDQLCTIFFFFIVISNIII